MDLTSALLLNESQVVLIELLGSLLGRLQGLDLSTCEGLMVGL